MKVCVELDTEEYYINEPDPEDSWDSGKRGSILRSVRVVTTDKQYGDEIDAKVGDNVFVLIEHYGDGDTFGSGEYHEAKGVYKTHKDAEQAANNKSTHHGYFGWHEEWIIREVPINVS